MPITTAAAEATEKEGFYKKFPGRDIAVKQLTLHEPTDNSKGLRIGNFVQIRDVVDEELESVWSGKKDAKTALQEWLQAHGRGLPHYRLAAAEGAWADAVLAWDDLLADGRSVPGDAWLRRAEALSAQVLAMHKRKVRVRDEDDDGRTKYVFVKGPDRAKIAALLGPRS